MKKMIAISMMFLFMSCAQTKIIALKGSYPSTPIISTTDNSFDKVWEKTIDYFAQNGIPIKIIDKSSGLIISDKATLSWSFEDKDGRLSHPSAFVVLQKILDKFEQKPFIPTSVTGEWNVRIKNTGNQTSINVNLYNIQAVYGQYYYSSYAHTMISPVSVEGKTTGVFENMFYNAVK